MSQSCKVEEQGKSITQERLWCPNKHLPALFALSTQSPLITQPMDREETLTSGNVVDCSQSAGGLMLQYHVNAGKNTFYN